MSLVLQRLNPTNGATYGTAITVGPISGLGRGTSIQNMIQPIPQSKHIIVPLGDQGPTITLTGKMHTNANFTELRKWWPSNWYVKATTSSLTDDIPLNSIWLVDEVKTTRKKAYLDWWDIGLQLTREWDYQAFTDAPIPFEPTTPTLRTDGINGVTLLDIESTDSITLRPYQLEYQFKGDKEIAAIPGQHHVQIPLGCQGPFVTMNAHVNGTDFDTIREWDGPKVSAVTATSFLEFDLDAAPTYYSRWLVNSIQFKQAATNAASSDVSKTWHDVTLSLVRYWDWELFNL